MLSLFFTLGSFVHDWGWSKNGPFLTKKGQTWQACQHSKVVQKGPKGTKMVNLSVFDHQEPFWAHLDPFGPFQTRIDILLRSTSANPYFVHLGQKNHFCLKWSKRVQMGPKWVPNDQKHLDIQLLNKHSNFDQVSRFLPIIWIATCTIHLFAPALII